MRINRQRKNPLGLLLRNRELACPIAKILIASHQMDRPPVLHATFEAACFDARQDIVAIVGGLHYEEMVNVPAIAVFFWQPKPAAIESLPVTAGNVAPAANPAVDPGKLQRQEAARVASRYCVFHSVPVFDDY